MTIAIVHDDSNTLPLTTQGLQVKLWPLRSGQLEKCLPTRSSEVWLSCSKLSPAAIASPPLTLQGSACCSSSISPLARLTRFRMNTVGSWFCNTHECLCKYTNNLSPVYIPKEQTAGKSAYRNEYKQRVIHQFNYKPSYHNPLDLHLNWRFKEQ